ncbi:uncharacterized protein FOMMEDRAFT_88640 [Fomitiporia mediterranea MF3/22]|uniref:uncharacterized protein n=1 Tax=Fomitiporia mediterranea (strain MF3/22) TaxID=694068 RepID=UPI000440866C|nr:uncharacterized protein FOMMEDRAFT_88640 [Fomitiporia mediterranea MF3/22]EJD00919.1 hypothetical protein FOMMEDRAFT_88640 [Fomitiporia mediterranea MF3/22]
MKWSIVFAIFGVSLHARGQLHPSEPAKYQSLPGLREQAQILDEWRQQRLDALPDLMKKYNVDAWLMSQREHAEDTIWWSIKSATEFAAHRRTVVLFHTNTSSLAGQPNPLLWIDNTGDVWPELRNILKSYNPDRIMVNTNRDIAFAGGMHVGEMAVLEEELGQRWTGRFVNVPMLAVEFVSRRLPGQIEYFAKMQETIWAMLEEAFSERAVVPDKTSTEDLEWWFRDKMQEQNVSTWNQPRVKVLDPTSFPGWSGSSSIIHEGDVLHVDFGISAMGMHTDTQHLGYVLRTSKGERTVPTGLLTGLKKANRMQDIVLEELQVGRTGNEVLAACNRKMKEEGIEGQVYSHPINDFAHGPGATIGFTNLPDFVPVYGELPILPESYYSIELFARHFVPERNESLRFMLEENVYWRNDTQRWDFIRGRQERFHIVDTSRTHGHREIPLLVAQR